MDYKRSINFILKKNITHGDALTLTTVSEKLSRLFFLSGHLSHLL